MCSLFSCFYLFCYLLLFFFLFFFFSSRRRHTRWTGDWSSDVCSSDLSSSRFSRPANSGTRFSMSTVARATPQLYTPQDRKSTRLNSSHPSISYAVFCLKKKKKKKKQKKNTHQTNKTRNTTKTHANRKA